MQNKTPKNNGVGEGGIIQFSVTKAEVITENDYPQLLLNIRDTAIFAPVTDTEVIESFEKWFKEAGTKKHICCYGCWEGEPLRSPLNADGLLPKSEWWVAVE